jgi:hypothetical protein
MSKIITGNDGLLPILGGYIYIKKEGKKLFGHRMSVSIGN